MYYDATFLLNIMKDQKRCLPIGEVSSCELLIMSYIEGSFGVDILKF